MGSSWFDRQSQSDERPRVEVTIDHPFALGRDEVTFAEWQACLDDGGCAGYAPADAGWGQGDRPVINVAWTDVQTYLVWLRAKTGKPYRLPTEAEWEFACRAGTATSYPFGDAIGPALANYDRQVGRTQEVGSYPPNPWGLRDMNGNVWEWVEDVYNDGHAVARATARRAPAARTRRITSSVAAHGTTATAARAVPAATARTALIARTSWASGWPCHNRPELNLSATIWRYSTTGGAWRVVCWGRDRFQPIRSAAAPRAQFLHDQS